MSAGMNKHYMGVGSSLVVAQINQFDCDQQVEIAQIGSAQLQAGH